LLNERSNALCGTLYAEHGGRRIVTLDYNDTDSRGQHTGDGPVHLRQLEAAIRRVNDVEAEVDFDKDGLRPVWEAIQTGEEVKVTRLRMNYRQFGGQGGNAELGGPVNYRLYTPQQQAEYKLPQTNLMISGLIAHELGHALGLNRKFRVRYYTAAKYIHDLTSGTAAAARATTRVPSDVEQMQVGTAASNPRWHMGDNGGDGEHCSWGCSLRPEGDKNIYRPNAQPPAVVVADAAQLRTCPMYHSNQKYVRDEGFCPTCVEGLRRGFRDH